MFERVGCRAFVMGVAPLPGGAHALVFGRELPRDEFEFKDSATRGAAPLNVLRQRASNEPVCPSLHCTKTAGNDDSSMAFDMLFDSMDDVDAVDMDDIQEDSESDEDRDEDTHDPVSVYVRYVTRTRVEPTRVESLVFAKRCLERSADAASEMFGKNNSTSTIFQKWFFVDTPMTTQYPKKSHVDQSGPIWW